MTIETEASEAGGEVTFVGGKAVEQTTSGESPDGDHGDELAAAKAAVKKAMAAELAEEGKTAAKEAKAAKDKDPLVPRDRGPNGKFASTDPVEKEKAAATKKLEKIAPVESDEEEEAAPPSKTASALRKALAERKETARYKAEANAELEKNRQEVRQFYAELQREKAQIAAEKEKLALFRKDPVRAIRENGWDNPEEFIMDIAQDGTPEGQARRAHRELLQRLEAAENWQKQELASREQAANQRKQQEAKVFRQNVEREMYNTAFAKSADGVEKHPHLATFYKGHEYSLFAEADVVAEQYRMATGQEASFAELAEYLEERAAKWYKQRRAAENAGSNETQEVSSVTQGRPTQGSATGKKSLSPSGSSERRTLGNSWKDLDGEERLEAAKTAVRAAIHQSGER